MKANKQNLSVKAMNELVAFIAKHQNEKNKLNAGEIREQIKLVVLGLLVGVSREENEAITKSVQATDKFKELAYEIDLKILNTRYGKV